MAQALRTVWLEPEEQQDATPQLQPRSRRRPTPAAQTSPLLAISLVAIIVGFAVAYISSYARIARYEFQRQARTAELRQIQDDCTRLKLEIANLESTSRVMRAAKMQNLEYPSPDRVHYIRVASNPLAPSVASVTPDRTQRSWLARAGHQMMARLDTVFHQLGSGPGVPAYAQE